MTLSFMNKNKSEIVEMPTNSPTTGSKEVTAVEAR